jgi:hypothetical protein
MCLHSCEALFPVLLALLFFSVYQQVSSISRWKNDKEQPLVERARSPAAYELRVCIAGKRVLTFPRNATPREVAGTTRVFRANMFKPSLLVSGPASASLRLEPKNRRVSSPARASS